MKRSTIIDVARVAGVSIKTVSRVLNDEPMVRESTRERVHQAMAELRYHPNSSARRLAGNRSYLLALLYDNPSASYITSIQEGSLSVCKNENYDLLIHPCQRHDPGLLDNIAHLVTNVRVDGLLLTSPISDLVHVRELLQKLEVPNVVIEPSEKGSARWTVATNDRETCAEMVRYLAGLGHQRIAFVQGHPDHLPLANRFEGYKDGMAQSGLKVLKSLCVQGYNSFDSGVECGRRLLGGKQQPTAVFCANDDMAAGVMRVAHEMKYSIPDDLSVAGFDDIPLANQIWPLLTTIRQPVHEIAQTATHLLISRLRGETPEGVKKVLVSQLVIRDSSGPAPIRPLPMRDRP